MSKWNVVLKPILFFLLVVSFNQPLRSMEESDSRKAGFTKFEQASLHYDEAATRIAREVLMIDVKNNSLIPSYENIITHGIKPIDPNKIKRRDVLVLGAGIAGLLSAKLLQDAGYNVTILEANKNRVGGRVKTFRHEAGKSSPFEDPSLYAEAGAMRIPTSHPLVNLLIKKLGLQTQDFYNTDVKKDNPTVAGKSTWVRANGKQSRSGEYTAESLGFVLPPEFTGKTAKELLENSLREIQSKTNPELDIEIRLKNWAEIIASHDQKSMFNFLQEHYPDRVVVDFIGTMQNLTSRLHLSFVHSFVDTLYINPETKYLEIVGGNYKLPYGLAAQLKPGTLVQNARAVKIRWVEGKFAEPARKHVHRGQPGVSVKTVGERVDEDNMPQSRSMDRKFTGDYLVCAVPFSALRFVDIEPLSYAKRRAVAELHYDSATKVLLEFNQRFWEWDQKTWEEYLSDEYKGHDSIGGGSITDSANRFIYYPSHAPEGSNGGVILASYTWSDEASRWDSIMPEDQASYALRGLTDIYGKGILRFYTGRSKTQSWMSNFYSFGEAAVFTPGQILGLYPNVLKNEGPIHFAGEHASMKHAWIEGAIESAIRAVLEIREKAEE